MSSKLLSSLIFYVLLLLLTACGGGGGGEGNRNIGPTITNTSPATINEGEEATLSVSASDSDGFIREIRWRQTAGPRVSFTNGRNTITFDAPDVTEDTILSFSVDAVDDFGAIASVDFSVTVLNVEGAKIALIVNQVSAVTSSFDHHWLTVQNISDKPINLSDFLIQTTGYDAATNHAELYTFTLPSFELQPGDNQRINLTLLNLEWPLSEAIKAVTLSSDNILPDWQNNGFIELFNQRTMQSEDLIRFGNNNHMPLFLDKASISTIDPELFPIANLFNRQSLADWHGLVKD